MQNLLNYTIKSVFFTYGFLSFILFMKCLLESSNNSSIFLISSIVSFIVGYFYSLLFSNSNLKTKSLISTIFFSWLLLILISSIPFFSLIKILDFNKIIFISTSYLTTTGFNLNFFNSLKEYDSLTIWISIIQLLGGFYSILTFILFFLVLFNKHDKLVLFNKGLIVRFYIYYFLLFIFYILIINFFTNDFFNSFLIASAIMSTGGAVGENGHLLDFYFSESSFLIIYSFLIFLTIFILPIFLYIHNNNILKVYYFKILKRSLFLFIILALFFIILIKFSILNFQENIFIFLSLLTTTGLMPNNASNLLVLQKLYPLFFIFLLLLVTGSFSGSSSGGLKIDRVSILFIKIKEELIKLTLRHKIYGVELIKKGSNQKELNSLYALIALGIFIIIFGVLFLSLSGKSLFDSFVLAIAALTNTGDGFLHLNNVDLIDNSNLILILNFLMICGRFEFIGYLLIFQKLTLKN